MNEKTKTRIIHGDMREVLANEPECSVHSVVTDPPYGLSFMGKGWDHQVPGLDYWSEVFRVLKPGGHVLAFGGTRTFHRMACAIEDAGFEMRDTFMYMYGTGFPKSHNLKDEWQGWGTALKPAWEPIIMARKPLIGTVAKNVMEHGTGALNINVCRLPTNENLCGGAYAKTGSRGVLEGDNRQGAAAGMFQAGKTVGQEYQQPAGRWPANVVHDGSDGVEAAFAEFGGAGNNSPSRFFYGAKASAADRRDSKHPTVKPVSLMRWLTRMVTPPGGIVLDPFAGSGTTGEAAIIEGFIPFLIEREEDYIVDIKRRIDAVNGIRSLI